MAAVFERVLEKVRGGPIITSGLGLLWILVLLGPWSLEGGRGVRVGTGHALRSKRSGVNQWHFIVNQIINQLIDGIYLLTICINRLIDGINLLINCITPLINGWSVWPEPGRVPQPYLRTPGRKAFTNGLAI